MSHDLLKWDVSAAMRSTFEPPDTKSNAQSEYYDSRDEQSEDQLDADNFEVWVGGFRDDVAGDVSCHGWAEDRVVVVLGVGPRCWGESAACRQRPALPVTMRPHRDMLGVMGKCDALCLGE